MDLPGDISLFQAHFDKLPGAAFIWRRDGDDFRIVAHNSVAASFGDSRAPDMIGRAASELTDFDPNFKACLHRASESGETFEAESDHRFETGLVRRVVDTFVPLSRDIVVVHGQDVTERRAIERRVRESEARFRALVDAIPDTMLRMDADARIVDVHFPKSLDPLPWRPEELIGRQVGEFYGPQAQDTQAYYNREAIRTGDVQVFQVRIPEPGRTVYLESRVVRIDDNEVVVTARDVTEHVELSRQETIGEQRERSLLSREIHDGLAQLLIGADLRLDHIRKCLEDEGAPYVADISSVCELLRQAVGQARELSHGLSPVPQDTPLFDALLRAAKHAERRFGIRCELVTEGRDTAVGQLSVTQLYRIVQEAIVNAVRHGGATTLVLRCTIDTRRLELTIEDNGCGLSQPVGDSDGDGLGLRIMRHRARAIGGEIVLEPVGRGHGAVLRCSCAVPALQD